MDKLAAKPSHEHIFNRQGSWATAQPWGLRHWYRAAAGELGLGRREQKAAAHPGSSGELFPEQADAYHFGNQLGSPFPITCDWFPHAGMLPGAVSTSGLRPVGPAAAEDKNTAGLRSRPPLWGHTLCRRQ